MPSLLVLGVVAAAQLQDELLEARLTQMVDDKMVGLSSRMALLEKENARQADQIAELQSELATRRSGSQAEKVAATVSADGQQDGHRREYIPATQESSVTQGSRAVANYVKLYGYMGLGMARRHSP